MDQILLWLVQTHPSVAGYLVAVGLLRQVFKPTFTLIQYLAQRTENKTDDQIVEKVEGSWAFKTISFLLDYTASIKVDQILAEKKVGKDS